MADQSPSPSGATPQASGLTIPAEVQEKFGALIELIKGSESMNMEERQYWVNILPIMTPEQIKNLEEILANEKKQLQAIDEKYSKEISTLGDDKVIAEMEEKLKNKRLKRAEIERTAQAEESKKEEDIMKQIQNI